MRTSSLHTRLFTQTILFFTLTLANEDPCPSFCRYRLCAKLLRDGNKLQVENRVLSLSFPDGPLGPFPCIQRKEGFVQSLRNVTGGEALVSTKFSKGKFIPISRFSHEGMNPSFPKRFFKWVRDPETGESAIQRRRLQGDQAGHIDQLCVRMPISSFLKRDEDGSFRRVRTKGKSACVGFRPIVTKLDIKFEWSSSNDFDLRVREPNGFEINRFGTNYESENGGALVADNGDITCQVVLGKEEIVYRRRDIVESGEYEVRVDQYRVCEEVSRYRLRVAYDEELILEKNGIVGKEVGPSVIEAKFTIP